MQALPLERFYDPVKSEKHWYDFWEKKGFFHADPDSNKKKYSIVIPPPNITGSLHMGHALNSILQDLICRFKRLNGYEVLWLPGTDHAGIATQNVIERELSKKGQTKEKIGYNLFLKQVEIWRNKYGNNIITQLKKLGCSCDWERTRFTMDKGLNNAVKKTFVELWKKKLIYKGNYIVNWCPRCLTALSDLENEHKELITKIYYIRYPFKTSKNEHLIIATTRPETLLGDTAVAINPRDQRYSKLKESIVLLPLLNKELPIIKDKYVSTEFGTGAMKVTPAHDINDFDLAIKHNLPFIKIMNNHGIINEKGKIYAGLDRFEARQQIVGDLIKEGFLEKEEKHKLSVGHCYRCGTIIEPMLSKQWFIKTPLLAKNALEVVKKGDINILPKRWFKTYHNWMINIKDWCISRQIWWGHRIPAWYCECGEVIVSENTPKICPKCKTNKIHQETDVLDTWFSSSLWPFSTMGWPEETPELKKFYPTDCLITAFDILFFWVARMIMMGLEITKKIPFKNVYIHALVRDDSGQKMSKSKGNVVNPLEIMEEYGTDAFRFTLTSSVMQGRDIKLNKNRINGYRNFVNKIWNAAQFTLINLKKYDYIEKKITIENRWILSRMSFLITNITKAIEDYRFSDASTLIYNFIWHEFCDWYLELIKPLLNNINHERISTQQTLYKIFSNLLILLHPFMPFLTEELWQKIPNTTTSIMEASWPSENLIKRDTEAEKYMDILFSIISAVRNIKSEIGIPIHKKVNMLWTSNNELVLKILRKHTNTIKILAKINQIEQVSDNKIPEKTASTQLELLTIHIPLDKIIDFSTELERIQKEIVKIDKKFKICQTKLTNRKFLDKAPLEVINKEKNKFKKMNTQIKLFLKKMEILKSFS